MEPDNQLLPGSMIENIANIYFDFNEPVITEPAVLEVSLSTSVSELEDTGFDMYPNPTNGNVTIVANEMIEQVEVLQLDGRVIDRVSANASRVRLDLSALSKGVYVVNVSFANEPGSSQLLMVE
jgi:hypothetical protein